MPQRQRASSKSKAKATGSKQEDDSPAARAGGEEANSEEQQQQQQRARRGGVSWSPVFKRIGFFMLLFLIPALLNYAALNQEMRMLVPNGINEYPTS